MKFNIRKHLDIENNIIEIYTKKYKDYKFELIHFLGTNEFHYTVYEDGYPKETDIIFYELYGWQSLEQLKNVGKKYCNMSNKDFDILCDIIAYFTNIYDNVYKK